MAYVITDSYLHESVEPTLWWVSIDPQGNIIV